MGTRVSVKLVAFHSSGCMELCARMQKDGQTSGERGWAALRQMSRSTGQNGNKYCTKKIPNTTAGQQSSCCSFGGCDRTGLSSLHTLAAPKQQEKRRRCGRGLCRRGYCSIGKSTGAPSFFVGCSSIALSANGEKGTLAATPFAEGSRRGGSEVADCVGAEIRYGTVRGSLAVGCCMTLCGPVG
jgi:hypothetical protein